MKIRVAYMSEPPFFWANDDGTITGANIEMSEVVLRAIGVTDIEYQCATFAELIPGVRDGRWDMNVPIFITPERSKIVTFSDPVWAMGDGFIIRSGNPKQLISYATLAANSEARLGVLPNTVQIDSAKSAGVSENQILTFTDQYEAAAAIIDGRIDAYTATFVGNFHTASKYPELDAVRLPPRTDGKTPLGAFSFNKNNYDVIAAVNKQLHQYIGTKDHLERMAKYGLTKLEFDSITPGRELPAD